MSQSELALRCSTGRCASPGRSSACELNKGMRTRKSFAQKDPYGIISRVNGIFKFWLLVVVGAALWQFAKWLRRKNLLEAAESWPSAQGRIIGSEIKKRSSGRGGFDNGDPPVRFRFFAGSGNTYYQANLNYVYTLTQEYSGTYSRQFDFAEDARNFAETMQNESVLVRYNPRAPQKSLVRKQDIETVLQSTAPPVALQKSPALGPAARFFLYILGTLSFAGFLLSAAVNIAGWEGRVILPFPSAFFAMHIGCILSFVPTAFLGQKMKGGWRSNRSWKSMLRNTPGWMRSGLLGLFGYTLVNFALFIYATGSNPHSGPAGPLEWRGFSGHWMLFFAISACMSYLAAKNGQDAPVTNNLGATIN